MQTLDALDAASKRSDIPEFRPGDTLKVHVKVIEGTRSRIQVFQGVVIRRQGSGVRETFTVRKVSFGVGVERTFPVEEGDEGPSLRESLRSFRDLGVLVVVAVLATYLVRAFLVAPFSIPSGSMENTLHPGDRILVDRLSYRLHDVRRGDVVVFDGTDAFGSLNDGGTTDYVKRVVGLPGDHVVCCDAAGRITVDGRALDESAYLHPGDVPSELRFDVHVPAGRLWLMGDHRSDSLDSRAHLGDPGGGFVPLDKVIGKVLVVVWPLSRLGDGAGGHVGFAPARSAHGGTTGTEGRTR